MNPVGLLKQSRGAGGAGTRSSARLDRRRGTERTASAKPRGSPEQAGQILHGDAASPDSGVEGVAAVPDEAAAVPDEAAAVPQAGAGVKGSLVAGAGQPDRNEVALTGRLSAAPTERVLQTGSRLTAFRLIVRRPAAPSGVGSAGEGVPKGARRTTVDVVDCAIWDADLARVLAGVAPGDHIAVRGALRRRFTSSGGRPVSWFTVEVAAIEAIGH